MKKKKKKFNPFNEIRNFSNVNSQIDEKDLELKALTFVRNANFLEAEKIYKKLIENNSNNHIVYTNLAAILQTKNVDLNVEELLKKAISLKPDFADAYSNLGCFYHSKKRLNEAITCYQKALDIKDSYPEANFNMGNAYRDLKDVEKAIIYLKKAIEFKKDYFDAHLNLATIFVKQKRIIDCLPHLKILSESEKVNEKTLLNTGKIYLDIELFNDAIKVFRKLTNLNKNNIKAEIELITAKKQICYWNDYDSDLRKIKKFIEDSENDNKNTYMYFEDNSEIHHKIAKSYSIKTFNNVTEDYYYIRENFDNRKIRIGYISSDFRDHPVTKLISRIIELHDSSIFDVRAYSLFNEIEDEYTQYIKNSVNKFINLSDKGDDEIISIIRKEKLDIAIDLMGFSRNAKPIIYAKRIAPIQINYLGYPGTMGSNFMDYIIADKILIPDEDKKFFSEKVMYLDKSPLCFDDRLINNIKNNLREKYNLPEKGFIFSCFNNNLKICPNVFEIWMQILHEVKGSIFWLYASNQQSKNNLIKRAELFNISKERLFFADYIPIRQHLKRHSQSDLFLDTFNFSAGATAVFSILSCCPIVTYCGNSYYSRMSASLLSSLNLEELIAYSHQEYKEKAIELALDNSKYKIIKEKLRKNLNSGEYLSSEIFTRELESKFKNILIK